MKSVARFLIAMLGMFAVAPGVIAGPYDGAWLCSESWQGGGTSFVAAVVTRSSDNLTAYGVVSTTPNQDEWGYGIGRISGSVFSGIDHWGKPFSLTVSGNSASGTGYVGDGSNFLPATLSCTRIW